MFADAEMTNVPTKMKICNSSDEQAHVLHMKTMIFAFFSCFLYSPCIFIILLSFSWLTWLTASTMRVATVLFSPHLPWAAFSPHISHSIQFHGTQLSWDLSCSCLASQSGHRHMSHKPHLAFAFRKTLVFYLNLFQLFRGRSYCIFIDFTFPFLVVPPPIL